MSDRTLKRLNRELSIVRESQIQHSDLGWSVGPVQDESGEISDLRNWEGFIFGTDDSPYQGAVFRITITFTDDYPIKAPKVKFVDVPFHPNVYEDGNICLDILKENWSPALQVPALLHSVRSLLTDPNVNSPANQTAARLYREDRAIFEEQVKQKIRQQTL